MSPGRCRGTPAVVTACRAGTYSSCTHLAPSLLLSYEAIYTLQSHCTAEEGTERAGEPLRTQQMRLRREARSYAPSVFMLTLPWWQCHTFPPPYPTTHPSQAHGTLQLGKRFCEIASLQPSTQKQAWDGQAHFIDKAPEG